mgnify:CR=1 FL=1
MSKKDHKKTNAMRMLDTRKVAYEVLSYEWEEGRGTGVHAAAELHLPEERVFKTLVASDDNGKLAVAVLPVEHLLNLKKLAKALGYKKMSMADPKLVERTTGYVLGGVSPLGQKKRLPTVIDASAQAFDTIFCSGGRRGLEIELSPDALSGATNAQFADLIQE